jgi:magnesium chelatase family protein
MALARTYAMALAGVQGHVVEIEADIENGLVALFLVGLPDTALREARDRIRSAIVNSGGSWPQRRVTVGLSPASLPKRGSGFDLATLVAPLSSRSRVAAAPLAAGRVVPRSGSEDGICVGVSDVVTGHAERGRRARIARPRRTT